MTFLINLFRVHTTELHGLREMKLWLMDKGPALHRLEMAGLEEVAVGAAEGTRIQAEGMETMAGESPDGGEMRMTMAHVLLVLDDLTKVGVRMEHMIISQNGM